MIGSILGATLALVVPSSGQDAADEAGRVRIARSIVSAIKSGKSLPTKVAVTDSEGAVVPLPALRKLLASCVVDSLIDMRFAGEVPTFGVSAGLKCSGTKRATFTFVFEVGKLSKIEFVDQALVYVPAPPPPPRVRGD